MGQVFVREVWDSFVVREVRFRYILWEGIDGCLLREVWNICDISEGRDQCVVNQGRDMFVLRERRDICVFSKGGGDVNCGMGVIVGAEEMEGVVCTCGKVGNVFT